jgi:hypothetical protein
MVAERMVVRLTGLPYQKIGYNRPMRQAIATAVLFCGIATAAGAQSTATLRGIDVYRSIAFPQKEARRLFEERLRDYVQLRNARTQGALEKAEVLRLAMQKEAAAVPGVAYVDLHIAEYFTSVDHAMYAVFDVVDVADASRLAFTPAPKAKLKDPTGVLAAWRAYVDLGEAVSRRGEMSLDRPNCPGFYCLWGGTPALDEAQKAFVEAAVKQQVDLRRILRADADGDIRSAALFVLSYSTSSKDVLDLCHEALSDSDSRVRGAALQILADIANHHPELPIALDRVLPRLDDPSAAVRGKTMGLLVPLAERPAYQGAMETTALRLVALLKLSQPESRDLAFTLVQMLSKKVYPRDDFASWDAWAAKPASARR